MPDPHDIVHAQWADRISDIVRFWRRVRVLVVTDTIVSFGPEQDPRNLNETWFGMSHLMGVLESIATVTKAHRSSDPLTAPGVLPNFRFTAANLADHDQVWLLGYGSGNALTPQEQEALARFMNGGGGVFATGDHASLGSGLAGTLPRVRSMRRWSAPPEPVGSTRVDTTVPDTLNRVVFENQSDDIPQRLQLKWYAWQDWGLVRRVYPHPLLCSSAGPIDVFPDHMHEGEVVEPTDLTASITFNGYRFDEYPARPDGVRVPPEIVAWGWTSGRADPAVMSDVHTGDSGTAVARWTGTVGAYDGRAAGVGRVVVDSTWHHFFDINLIGDNAANRASVTDPRRFIWREGFRHSPEGQQVLAQIDQYFRNIVRWLSPGVGSPFAALALELAVHRDLLELVHGQDIASIELGRHAWVKAIRLHPPCTVIQWAHDLLDRIPRLKPHPFGPWDWPYPGPDDPGPRPLWSPQEMTEAALGAAILAVHEHGPKRALGKSGAATLALAGLSGMQSLLKQRLGQMRRDVDALGQLMSEFEPAAHS